MRFLTILAFVGVGLLLTATAPTVRAQQLRTWTDKSEKFQIQARFLEAQGPYTRLAGSDGKVFRIKTDALSVRDRDYIENLQKSRSPAAAAADRKEGPNQIRITPPPPEKGFDPFYRQHADLEGFSIVASGNVDGKAIMVANQWVRLMVSKRPELLRQLIVQNVRLAIIAKQEVTTDIPENRELTPPEQWNQRTRGVSASGDRLAVSCGEENLLQLKDDQYYGENVLVHEMAHTIHQMAMPLVDPEFDRTLERTYYQAMKQGLWKDTHAASNYREYWAEGVQSWFNVNREASPADGIHGEVNTRQELQKYDPALFRLIATVFP